MKRVSLMLLVVAGLGAAGCAKARHVAVQGDVLFAEAVFALDDAEYTACQQHVLTDETCALLGPKIKQALVDVKAVTAALQATPKDGAIPKNLPSLLQNLADANAIVAQLTPGPVRQSLVLKAAAAINAAIAFLKQLAGG